MPERLPKRGSNAVGRKARSRWCGLGLAVWFQGVGFGGSLSKASGSGAIAEGLSVVGSFLVRLFGLFNGLRKLIL